MSFYITPAGGHGRRLEVSREALENERQAILAEHRADSLFDYLRGSTLVYELPEEEVCFCGPSMARRTKTIL